MKDRREIGRNVSSGAEKVERVESETKREELMKKEDKLAEKRVQLARERAELKAKKERAMRAEDEAYFQEMEERAKRRAARQAERNAKFEREIAEIERERERRRMEKARERQERSRGGRNRKEYGGWLAAVIALGVTCLALTAALTVGAVNMVANNSATAASYRATVYELTSSVEKTDDSLDKLRVSASPAMQRKLLTDVLVQTTIVENDLEKMPIGFEKDGNTMRFFNRTSGACQMLLDKLERGQGLDERDYALLQRTYEINHGVRQTLNELTAMMEHDDAMMLMKGKTCRITDAFDKIENATTMPEPKKGDKGKTPMKGKDQPDGITSAQAEEFCKYYFADYGVATMEYAGEMMAQDMSAYNFSMTDGEGTKLFAQIEKKTGALLRFDYYKECNDRKVDVQTAKNLAAAYLEKFGYEDMVAVRVDESGTNVDFTFAYQNDGCVFYPDEVVVKVCEERGLVIGLDASKFLKNHRDRDALNAVLTIAQAQEKLHDKLTVEASRLVVFQHKGKEYAAYEFFCSYDGQYYFVYTDANTGEELFLVNAKNA